MFLTNPFSAVRTIIVRLQAMDVTKIYRFLLILLCTVIVFANKAAAQKTYFVYLQSDNQQPFYVILNGKNFSSSSIGYVILSKLRDSTYPIRVGFPGTGAVQEFDLKVSGDDQGFLVKDFGEKGWGLFNLQSLAVQMNSNGAKKKADDAAILAAESKRKADSINLVAAQLAETQKADSIKQAVARQEQLKTDSVAAVKANTIVKADTPAIVKTNTETTAPKEPPAATITTQPPAEIKSKVDVLDSAILTKQLIEHDTVSGVSAESTETPVVALKDTVSKKAVSIDSPVVTGKIVIDRPIDSVKETSAVEKVGATSSSPKFLDMELHTDTTETIPVKKVQHSDTMTVAKSNTVVEVKTVTNKEDTGSRKKETGLSSNNSNTKIVTVPAPSESAYTASLAFNPACRQSATDKDFFALRKKMVSTEDADEMISIAKKVFKEKCFTTEQVRNLTVLFLDDAGRYGFLDEVYTYTSDQINFKQLADLLKDSYYLKRFNAMLK